MTAALDSARLDHLVVLAPSLAEGVSWCESTLGVTPGAGGEHPLMGTHNRLLRLATVDYPRAYFEIIACNPAAAAPRRTRWFDMDDAAVQATVAAQGPRLAHFVVSVPDLAAARAALAALGIDPGEPLQASRMTDRGLLHWTIGVRPDGRRLFDGCLPTLIEWGDVHPAAAMPESGLAIQALAVTHPRAAQLQADFNAIGLRNVRLDAGPANLGATLHTPHGRIRLESKGL